MTKPRHDHPGWAWALIAVTAIAADLTGSTTLSTAFRTASRHKIVGPVIATGWTVLTLHLFGFIPPHYDPFHRLGCFGTCEHG